MAISSLLCTINTVNILILLLIHHYKSINFFFLYSFNLQRSRNFFEAFQKVGQDNLKVKRAKEREMGIISPETQTKAERERIFVKSKMDLMKSNVYYQYKEGYTNAVRRKVFMKDLL